MIFTQQSSDNGSLIVPPDHILGRLAQANDEESWGISKATFNRLTDQAPRLPTDKIISLRIRFGGGAAGVATTFAAHVLRMQKVFGESGFWRRPQLSTAANQLRLLVGNSTHLPTVAWIAIDLCEHRDRHSVFAVREPASLADELLVFAWLFPDYIRSIDHDERPGLLLGGYECTIPDDDIGAWQQVPCIDWNPNQARVELYAEWRGNFDPIHSVPALRFCRGLNIPDLITTSSLYCDNKH